MDPNQTNDDQNQGGQPQQDQGGTQDQPPVGGGQPMGGVPAGDQAPTTPSEEGTQEKCHCGRAVEAGNCVGCNQPSANCTCEPEQPAPAA